MKYIFMTGGVVSSLDYQVCALSLIRNAPFAPELHPVIGAETY